MAREKILETKFCQICGTEFQGIKMAKFCSDKCKEQRKKELAIMNREKKKAEAKKKKNSETEWKAIVRKCKEMGVSYGEAVRRGLI
jgi:orotate phosphoribosyltransferase